MTVSILRLLGVRPRERGEPGAQLRVGLGGPAPGQRAPRAVEQQSPSEPVVSGQQRGAPPRLERDLAGRSDVRYADVSQHFVEPLDGFLNRSTVHPRFYAVAPGVSPPRSVTSLRSSALWKPGTLQQHQRPSVSTTFIAVGVRATRLLWTRASAHIPEISRCHVLCAPVGPSNQQRSENRRNDVRADGKARVCMNIELRQKSAKSLHNRWVRIKNVHTGIPCSSFTQ